MGKMDVSFTEVLHKADITAASRRLLDVRKLASAMSWNTGTTNEALDNITVVSKMQDKRAAIFCMNALFWNIHEMVGQCFF